MDFSEILSIAGKPGLYKVVSRTKNGIIVESIIDQKRFTAFSNERISSLEEISVFTEDEDMPLKDVLKSFYEKNDGKASIDHKSDNAKLKTVFEEAVPEYDKERVYVSDIKKIIQWYNLLAEKKMLDFKEEEEKTEESEANLKSPEAKTEKNEE